MMKNDWDWVQIKFWISGNNLAVRIKEFNNHFRPATEGNYRRCCCLLFRLYNSGQYSFRPFLGEAFGIVAEEDN